MRKLLAPVLLAAMLTSCATWTTVKTISGFEVSQKSVAIAVESFDAAKITATNILKLPDCTANQKVIRDGCITQSLGRTLVSDVDAGTAARNSLWVSSKGSTQGVGVRAAYDAVIAATTALQKDTTP